MKKRINFLVVLITLFTISIFAQVNFNEIKSLEVKNISSITYDGSNILVYNKEQNQLYIIDSISNSILDTINLSIKGDKITFGDNKLFLTSNKEKKIYVIDKTTGRGFVYIDLKNIRGIKADMYLEPLRSGEILGITYGNGHIWLGTGAGYSSSIYEIDPLKKIVISHRFAPGPTPIALWYYKNNLWVIDKDSELLRCIKNSRNLVYNIMVKIPKDTVGIINIKNKVYIAQNQRNNSLLKGVEIQELQKLVPSKLEYKIYEPFKNKKRKTSYNKGPRKVAVLISGDTAASGFNEFWTDVVIMYRILKSRGYNEIYVLYANGKDYDCGWEKYQEKMTDFAATKSNVERIFNALANGDSQLGIEKLKEEDILFIYTFDHGSSDGRLCLWNYGRYSPQEMRKALENITCDKKIVYMQQCFSGAFKVEFEKTWLYGVAIVTATSDKEYAYRADTEKEYYNGKTYYHGEFNWHFMSALMGKTPTGEVVNADANGDGIITILETYEYYKKMNSQPRETPQYHSNPEWLGQKTTP